MSSEEKLADGWLLLRESLVRCKMQTYGYPGQSLTVTSEELKLSGVTTAGLLSVASQLLVPCQST